MTTATGLLAKTILHQIFIPDRTAKVADAALPHLSKMLGAPISRMLTDGRAAR